MQYRIITLLLTLIFPLLGHSQPPVVKSMLIFPNQEKHVHGSSIVALPSGDFLAVWFEGSGERTANDVLIMGARLQKGATKWSKPFLMADTPGLPDCNPVLFLNQEKKLFLVWIAVQANEWETSILRYKTSTKYDGSEAPVWDWQDNILLNPGDEFEAEVKKRFKEMPDLHRGWATYAAKYDDMIIDASRDRKKRTTGWMTRIKPLVYPNGKILLPLYSDGFNFSLVGISEDHGNTWKPSLPIVGRGPIQPALIQKKDGTLVAYMRDSGDAPNHVHTSESKDGGKTWSASVLTDIPNTASVEMLSLKDGRWVFLGNTQSDGRYRITLMISADEGKTWTKKINLEDKPKGEGSFSYPSLIQTEDGMLHMTYTAQASKNAKSIKYVVVNPDKF